MPNKKNITIDYTSREFETIKQDLVDHAKRFYPDHYKDFTTPSFGSMVLDSVAYVGDLLSYYIDYSVNESFLDTAVEFTNIRKHARAMGYKFQGLPSSFGTVSFFLLCPANAAGTAPDLSYLPILKKGAMLGSTSGGNFILSEDIIFSGPSASFVAARFNPSTGATTYFAVKATGQVESGQFYSIKMDLSNSPFEKFKRIKVGGGSVSEIYSVFDSEGNKYYEVDHLSQEVIFVETTNKDASTDGVRSILKPFVTTRKFIVYQDDTGTYLQFGFGSEDDDSSGLLEPEKIALKMHGKNSISDHSFDPTKLLSTNKLGISPYNTTLDIVIKRNAPGKTHVGSNSINEIAFSELAFTNENVLTADTVRDVRASLECINEEPITGGGNRVSTVELKERAKAHFASQNRVITKQDYESLIYQMPPKFGSVTRANIVNDPSSTNRNIDIYVVSKNVRGKLSKTHQVVKNNIKNWLSHYIPINDSINIKDATVVNIGVEFIVVSDRNYSSDEVLFSCQAKLKKHFTDTLYIGEPLYLTKIYNVLNNVNGVFDVKNVKVINKKEGAYSNVFVEVDSLLSRDGTYIKVPKNVILELKYPNVDIKGVVR